MTVRFPVPCPDRRDTSPVSANSNRIYDAALARTVWATNAEILLFEVKCELTNASELLNLDCLYPDHASSNRCHGMDDRLPVESLTGIAWNTQVFTIQPSIAAEP